MVKTGVAMNCLMDKAKETWVHLELNGERKEPKKSQDKTRKFRKILNG
jgi:hypothetical protein